MLYAVHTNTFLEVSSMFLHKKILILHVRVILNIYLRTKVKFSFFYSNYHNFNIIIFIKVEDIGKYSNKIQINRQNIRKVLFWSNRFKKCTKEKKKVFCSK